VRSPNRAGDRITVRTLLGDERALVEAEHEAFRGEAPRAVVRFADGTKLSAYWDAEASEWVAVGVPRRAAESVR